MAEVRQQTIGYIDRGRGQSNQRLAQRQARFGPPELVHEKFAIGFAQPDPFASKASKPATRIADGSGDEYHVARMGTGPP